MAQVEFIRLTRPDRRYIWVRAAEIQVIVEGAPAVGGSHIGIDADCFPVLASCRTKTIQ